MGLGTVTSADTPRFHVVVLSSNIGTQPAKKVPHYEKAPSLNATGFELRGRGLS